MPTDKRPQGANPETTETSAKPKRKKEWTRAAMEEEFRKPHFGGNNDRIADDDREALKE